MTTRTTLLSCCAALISLAAAQPLRADTMTFNGVGLHDTVTLHSPGHVTDRDTVSAGQYMITYKGQSYAAWCVDIDQYSGTSSVVEESYTVLPNDGAVAYLFETYAGSLSSGVDAAALAVCIWEVINEPEDGAFNIYSGDFWISGNSTVANRAASMLASIPSSYSPAGNLIVLHSDTKQDMLIGTGGVQTPEPGCLVLLASGAALATWRHRRSR